MTITTLQAAAQDNPRLWGLPVECLTCGKAHPIREQTAGCHQQLATILVTDDPGEVASMSRATTTPPDPCPKCGGSDLIDHTVSVDPYSEVVIWCLDCEEIVADLPPRVTSRIYLWDGSPVDWDAVLPEWPGVPDPFSLDPPEVYRERILLTAVVLVGEPALHSACDPESGECGGCDAHTWRIGGCDCIACHGEQSNLAEEAREVCAQAGVQFTVLGDGTAVAL